MSSSVSLSVPLQLAELVLARNLCQRSLLLLNTSSMLRGAGGPNTCIGSVVSCRISADRSAGESAHGAILIWPSSSLSSSSVCMSGSSIASPFWKRGEALVADFAADFAADLLDSATPAGLAGV